MPIIMFRATARLKGGTVGGTLVSTETAQRTPLCAPNSVRLGSILLAAVRVRRAFQSHASSSASDVRNRSIVWGQTFVGLGTKWQVLAPEYTTGDPPAGRKLYV